ncbi:MFS general substrate transporter [Thelephora ganbajun]|uniref:MFS general substrate transporter n=1 Tax=Thelephora ganbajun TaxID=370292 RepID=A0ACB6ZDT6_THEGA|nr:MFS general substrate transporter [Thelephora ganbajun]
MSRPPNNRSSRSTSAHSSMRRSRSRPRRVPYLPLPSDIPINPDSPVSEQAAELIHEFVHPHHHSGENLLEPEEELDEANGDAPIIAKELEEMRSRAWWRRPSALWFLSLIPFVLAASTATAAPKIQAVTHLVCKTLRPGYTNRSGANPKITFFSASDDEETKLCNADPVVLAASAEFLTLITTATGILSCLTTAYWGSRSDRKGRINTMRICLFGNLITDLTYLLVYSLLRGRNGAYWFLLIAPVFEGSLGGLSAASANIHAYVADCTDPARRSRVFSIYLGLVYIGMAIGPAFGGLLIRQSGDLLTVFYYAFASHLCFACTIWFVVPESLAPTQLSRAKAAYNERKARARGGIGGVLAHLVSFLAPLKLFIPVTVATGDNPLKRRKDWNLTLLAAAYGLVIMLVGAYSFKFQYAASTFGWSTEILGYWMSVAGLTRAIALAFIIPDPEGSYDPSAQPAMSTLHTQGPAAPEPIIRVTSSQSTTTTQTNHTTHTHPDAAGRTAMAMNENKDPSSPYLDLNTARVSLVMELTAYTMMATAKTGTMFTLYTVLGSLAAGFMPAIQSLALWIYAGRGGEETGKLFGSLSVVQALGGSILSPMLFGFTYSRTVATFPQAMFIVGASAVALALLCTFFIRLPKGETDELIVVTEDGDVGDGERERLIPGSEEEVR